MGVGLLTADSLRGPTTKRSGAPRARTARGWWRFLGGRAVRLVLLLVAVAFGAFTLITLSPIDPMQAYIGADMSRIGPEQRALIEQRWGFDQPPMVRFGHWAAQILQGNLGYSMVYGRPVADVIGSRFMASLALLAIAWLISGLLGFVMGILAGAHRGRVLDRVLTWWAYTLASAPTFWVGLILLYVFSVALQWTPICCSVPIGVPADEVTLWARLHHLLLPALTLSLVGVAPIALHTRQAVIETLGSDHVAFARAQGERAWGLILHRVLRNAAAPAVMLQFASFGELFGGSILAEQVFSYPGLGQATTTAALRQDVPLLMGIALFTTVFVFAGNFIGDIVRSKLDPRAPLGTRS